MSSDTPTPDRQNHWWCPKCKEVVPPIHVTFQETHDGVCGCTVEWLNVETTLALIARQEAELAALKAELAEYRAATDPHYVDELAEARASNHDVSIGEMLDKEDEERIGLLGRPAELQFVRLAADYNALKAEIERRDAFMVTAAETLRKTEADNERLRGALERIATCLSDSGYPSPMENRLNEACRIISQALASWGRENTNLTDGVRSSER